MLLASSFDLPAKCLFQNFNQFNGFFGCSVCEKPGEGKQLKCDIVPCENVSRYNLPKKCEITYIYIKSMSIGSTCTTSARGHTHAYPMSIEEFKSPNGHPQLRTPKSTKEYARQAVIERKPVWPFSTSNLLLLLLLQSTIYPFINLFISVHVCWVCI